jgi:hypothetical protein
MTLAGSQRLSGWQYGAEPCDRQTDTTCKPATLPSRLQSAVAAGATLLDLAEERVTGEG